MTESLAISFRGDRTYLHGTDLYSAVHSAFLRELEAEALTDIRFKIPQFYRRPVVLEITPGIHGSAVLQCSANAQVWSGHLHDDPSAPAPQRVAFDEDAIMQAMRVSGRTAEFTSEGRWTAIERIVFLGKFLNIHLDPPAAEKQWVFTQLELDRSLRNDAEVSVEFGSALEDFFTKSAVLISGVKCGSVYFAKVDRVSHEMRGLK